MLVIGDACTINYLLRASVYEDVYKYFEGLIVPEKVKEELEGTPAILELQMTMYPLKVLKVEKVEDVHLDPGETEAIALYKQIKADMFLTDDKAAYNYCKIHSINVMKFIEVISKLSEIIDIKKVKEKIISDTNNRLFTLEIHRSINSEV